MGIKLSTFCRQLSVGLFLTTLCSLVQADVDTALVYYGDADQEYSTPGQVSCAEIFVEIPEYQKILEKNLDTGSGEYWTLLRKANDRFQNAVRKTAKRHNLDLICEKGQLACVDYTDEVKAIVAEESS